MERLLTPSELASILGLAEQSIYNRKCNGYDLPPAVRLGRTLRFPESGVKAWIENLPQAYPSKPVEPVAIVKRPRGRPSKAAQFARRNH